MPIRFRCSHCNRLLGIARRKAGTEIRCPHCDRGVTVPRPAAGGAATELDEIDELLGHPVGANGVHEPEPAAPVVAPPPPRVEPVRPSVAVAPPKPAAAKRKKPGDSLFETGDVDELLGVRDELRFDDELPPAAAPVKAGPKPVSGMDVQSLAAGDGTWVISPHKASLLIVAVVALLGVAFAAGFVVASLL